MVKLWRGLKLGWSVDKSHGRVAWSTAQDRSGVGGASFNFGFGFLGPVPVDGSMDQGRQKENGPDGKQ